MCYLKSLVSSQGDDWPHLETKGLKKPALDPAPKPLPKLPRWRELHFTRKTKFCLGGNFMLSSSG